MDIAHGAWALRLSERKDDRVRVTVVRVSPARFCALSIADPLLPTAPAVDLPRFRLDEAERALHLEESSCAS